MHKISQIVRAQNADLFVILRALFIIHDYLQAEKKERHMRTNMLTAVLRKLNGGATGIKTFVAILLPADRTPKELAGVRMNKPPRDGDNGFVFLPNVDTATRPTLVGKQLENFPDAAASMRRITASVCFRRNA